MGAFDWTSVAEELGTSVGDSAGRRGGAVDGASVGEQLRTSGRRVGGCALGRFRRGIRRPVRRKNEFPIWGQPLDGRSDGPSARRCKNQCVRRWDTRWASNSTPTRRKSEFPIWGRPSAGRRDGRWVRPWENQWVRRWETRWASKSTPMRRKSEFPIWEHSWETRCCLRRRRAAK